MTKNKINLTSIVTVCILAMFCCFLWGSAFPCIKIGYELFEIESTDTFSIILFAGARFILAGVLTVIFGSILLKKPLLPSKKSIGKIAHLSVYQTILQYLFFYIGVANTTGVKASILDGASVFIALFVSGCIFKLEKISKQKVIGMIIGFIGVVLINLTGLTFDFNFFGDGFVLISAFAYGMSSVYMNKYSRGEDGINPVLLSGWQFIVGGVVMTLVGLIMGGKMTPTGLTSMAMFIYLGLLSAIAYSVWSILLKHNDVSKVTIFGFFNPIFGTVLSSLLLDEGQSFGIVGFISLALVCIGIYFANIKKKT